MSNNIFGYNNKIVSTRKENTLNNNLPVGFLQYSDNRNQIVLYDTSMNYNPSSETLSVTNIIGTVTGPASNIDITDTNNDETYYITFVDSSGNNKVLRIDETSGPLKYNPSSGLLTTTNLSTGQINLAGDIIGLGSEDISGINSITASVFNGRVNGTINVGDLTSGPFPVPSTIKVILGIEAPDANTQLASNDNLKYDVSSNILYSSYFNGDGNSLTNLNISNLNGTIPNSKLTNDSITIGTTEIDLGSSSTNIAGLNQLSGSSKSINFSTGSISGFTITGDNVVITDDQTTNSDYKVVFTDSDGSEESLLIDGGTNGLKFNPSTNTLSCLTTDAYATGLSLSSFTGTKSFVFASGSLPGGNDVFRATTSNICFDNTNNRLGIGVSAPTETLVSSGTVRALGATVSNEPSITLSYGSNTANVEARGTNSTTVANMAFYVATEAFQTSHLSMYIKGSNGYVGIKNSTPFYQLDTLHTASGSGFSTGTMSALFQTTTGAGRHGIGIGGDVLTGNGFLQSVYNDTNTGFNIILQPMIGNVAIGNVNPTYKLQLATDSAGKPSTNTWTIVSDKRIKKNITELSKDILYEKAKNYKIKKFNYKEDYLNAHELEDRNYIGIIADEVEEYMPCCIEKRDIKLKVGDEEKIIKDCKSFKSTELDYILKGCIPHLIKENEELKNKVQNQGLIIESQKEINNMLEWKYENLLSRIIKLETENQSK